MPIELSELMQLALERRPSLKVGDLPRPIAEIMGCHPAIVFLGAAEFKHIAQSHPEMRREEFQLIFQIIKTGSYYQHPDYPTSVTVFGDLEHDGKLYMLGLKSAQGGCEVWVQTMFRIGHRKALRRIRNSVLIHGAGI